MQALSLLALPLFFATAIALNNNQGLLPELGYNSWYAQHSHLVNYSWAPGYVASTDFLAIARWLRDNGLVSLGYTYANWDDCIVIGRDPVTKALIPDPQAFPHGVRAVADEINALGMKMGWYSVRGNLTCASIKPYYPQRPGSNLYEKLDAETYAAWGVAYLKFDTCVGPNVPYDIMGRALNESGKQVFYSLCEPGQGPQTAPVGRATGNGWRVDEVCALRPQALSLAVCCTGPAPHPILSPPFPITG